MEGKKFIKSRERAIERQASARLIEQLILPPASCTNFPTAPFLLERKLALLARIPIFLARRTDDRLNVTFHYGSRFFMVRRSKLSNVLRTSSLGDFAQKKAHLRSSPSRLRPSQLPWSCRPLLPRTASRRDSSSRVAAPLTISSRRCFYRILCEEYNNFCWFNKYKKHYSS